MKRILFLFFIFHSLGISAQMTGYTNKDIYGTVVDSITNDTINGLRLIIDPHYSVEPANLSGNFSFHLSADPKDTVIVKENRYETRILHVNALNPADTLHLKMIRNGFYPITLSVSKKANDTTFYKSKKIQKIEYDGMEVEYFYESGKREALYAWGDGQEWYENGNLKQQTLLKNIKKAADLKIETNWYENGKVMSYGTWNRNNPKGEWKKNTDWLYWDNNGNRVKK